MQWYMLQESAEVHRKKRREETGQNGKSKYLGSEVLCAGGIENKNSGKRMRTQRLSNSAG